MKEEQMDKEVKPPPNSPKTILFFFQPSRSGGVDIVIYSFQLDFST